MRLEEHTMKPFERRPARRSLRVAVILGAMTCLMSVPVPAAAGNEAAAAIRPFRVKVTDAELADLKRRLAATRWPDRETVADQSQGVPLATLQELVRYWRTEYDWRKGEARLNAYPQFMTTIDGVAIHFIHVRSRHPNAMPLILTHGWPGSVFEQIKLVGPLTDPTAHGGRAEDAFDVVIPSLPGFGFSGRPSGAGWGLERIGRAWDVLMTRLGYTRYVAQGGDWGAGVVQAMGRQAPPGLLGIHTNLPAAVTNEVGAVLGGAPMPAEFSAQERAAIDDLRNYRQKGGLTYLMMLGARPQTVGYGLTDSPAGLAGWMLVHGGFDKWSFGKDPTQSPTRDDVLDNVTLYWLTNTAASSARIYWENRNLDLISAAAQKTGEISVPVAITVFPDEVFRAQERWARSAFKNLIYFNHADRGGHFAMWEHPELFAAELRAAFRSLDAPQARALPAGIRRLDLQRHDLSAPGREVVQTIVELNPGVTSSRHTHPGEEIVYVLEGAPLEYQVEGRPPVTLKPGEVLFIPASTAHSARNVGTRTGAELATYVVEKGKPLLTDVAAAPAQ
jgi:pimeloyl-ACP methyl ester carboxylesterase/quercetin dioxygenase-like cupin family protein